MERAQSASWKNRNASDWGRGSSKSKSPVTPNIIFTLIISHSLSYKVRRRFAIRPEIQSHQTNSHVAQICVTGHPFSQSKVRRIFFFFSKHFAWKLILFSSFRLDGQERRFFKARRAGYESEYYGINNMRSHIVRKSKFSLRKFSSLVQIQLFENRENLVQTSGAQIMGTLRQNALCMTTKI